MEKQGNPMSPTKQRRDEPRSKLLRTPNTCWGGHSMPSTKGTTAKMPLNPFQSISTETEQMQKQAPISPVSSSPNIAPTPQDQIHLLQNQPSAPGGNDKRLKNQFHRLPPR